jgi:two-component system OmpR family response regulator
MASVSGVRVLIVEDDVDARDMYVLWARRAGMHVRAASDMETAFAIAVEWQPHVVVTDFLLGGSGSGAELCRRMHEDGRTSHIPTLVMTGSTRAADAEAILGAGCADIRVKPYLPDALVKDVDRLSANAPVRRSTA